MDLRLPMVTNYLFCLELCNYPRSVCLQQSVQQLVRFSHGELFRCTRSLVSFIVVLHDFSSELDWFQVCQLSQSLVCRWGLKPLLLLIIDLIGFFQISESEKARTNNVFSFSQGVIFTKWKVIWTPDQGSLRNRHSLWLTIATSSS